MNDIKSISTKNLVNQIKEQLEKDNNLSLDKICTILNLKLSSVKTRLKRDNIKFTELKLKVKELYAEVKKIARKENISITDIFNTALIDYINKST